MLWNNKLEVGVPKIDNQHKELFRRIDELLGASQQQQGRNKIQETLDFLRQYIIQHFNDEQALHTQSKYPKAAIHKGYHDAFIRAFHTLEEQYHREGESLSMILKLNRTVVDWLTQHIQVHDKEFALYYNQQKK